MPVMDPTISDLVARGGWAIEDPRPHQAKNPETFWLPDEALRATIRPGSTVRAIFLCVDEEDDGELVIQGERMPILVESRNADVVGGRLAAQPVSAHAGLELGQPIEFRSTDAIDVLDPDDDWEEHRGFLQSIFEGDEAFERWQASQRDT